MASRNDYIYQVSSRGRSGAFAIDAVLGDVMYHSVVNKFGINRAVSTSTETVWPLSTSYVWPDGAGEAMTISSTSANDTSGGTGARTVKVYGLGADFATKAPETFTMNGQTGVSIGTWGRINNLEVIEVGSGDFNIGNIHVGTGTITAGVPATTYGYVEAEDGISQSALFTTSSTCKGVLTRFQAASRGGGSGSIEFRLVMRKNNGAITQARLTTAEFTIQSGTEEIDFDFGLYVPPKTDVEVIAVSTQSNRVAFVSFDLMEVEVDT